MTYQTLAEKIPGDKRQLILERNMVVNANGVNEFMKYLFEVWYLFIEPNGSKNWDCGYCRQNVKNNFEKLLPSMIEMEKQKNLLDAV